MSEGSSAHLPSCPYPAEGLSCNKPVDCEAGWLASAQKQHVAPSACLCKTLGETTTCLDQRTPEDGLYEDALTSGCERNLDRKGSLHNDSGNACHFEQYTDPKCCPLAFSACPCPSGRNRGLCDLKVLEDKVYPTRIQTSNLCYRTRVKTMADPSSFWAQPDILQSFSVTVMPIGHLASENLQSFDYVLFTSESAEQSASGLTVFVKQRLDLQVQPLFYVSIAGKPLGLVLDRIISRFLGEIASNQQQSAFDQSDAIAGQLTIFCDLAAPRPAPAARPASATDKQALAPSGQQQGKGINALSAAANEAVHKYWNRISTDLEGTLHSLVLILHLSLSCILSRAHCVCRQAC